MKTEALRYDFFFSLNHRNNRVEIDIRFSKLAWFVLIFAIMCHLLAKSGFRKIMALLEDEKQRIICIATSAAQERDTGPNFILNNHRIEIR